MSFAGRILFPIDFSLQCEAIAPGVAAMARHFRAEIALLHAVQASAHPADAEAAPHLDQLSQLAERRLASFLTDAFEGLVVHRSVVTGSAGDAIVHFASEWPAGLIMMPTRGHTRFRQLLLGSTTAAVLHSAHVPVWTTAHQEADQPAPVSYRTVVCAIDTGGHHAAAVLAAAREFAESWGAKLHVIHAVPAVDPRFYSAAAGRAHAFLVQSARDEYAKLAPQLGLRQDLEVLEEATVPASVAKACREHSADLLIIGRGAIAGFLGRLRSTAHDLIRSSPCPVLSV
jgi:nucleotide-binding universal stress UspA family protein